MFSCSDPPTVRIYPEKVYFPDRGSFNLSCSASGDPKPEIHWYLEGQAIKTSPKYYVTLNSKKLLFFKLSYHIMVTLAIADDLMVRSASSENSGTYECRAVSAAGHTSAYAEAELSSNLDLL